MNEHKFAIELANPRGFCAGVERAITIVEQALEMFGPPIYVRHEVVHNRAVVENLRERGAVFVEELRQVPGDCIVIFSAHGVSKAVQIEARRRKLRVFDATCPLVTKVHMEVIRFAREGRECVLIGHDGHPEVEGTMGQYQAARREGGAIYLIEDESQADQLQVRRPDELSYVTQTTLSMDDTRRVIEALKKRFPRIAGPKTNDICYATQNRQQAARKLAKRCDLALVVGSPNSSNSNRLRELIERDGARAELIENAGDIDCAWLDGARAVGVTAGASAPEALVRQVVARLVELGGEQERELEGIREDVTFPLPAELRKARGGAEQANPASS